MNFVSLFAGVGGFDLAFERAGMKCVAQVEIDAKCREVLAAHWPDVPRFEDVHEVTASRIQMASGRSRGNVGRRNGDVPNPAGRRTDPGNLLLVGNVHGTGSIDVLCGGFPCQDYSVAGKRGGLAGDRGALWWQFHRLIAECRPRWVVGENVPGLLSSNGGRDFGAIVGSLVELGYGVVWRVLDAQYFGVAQRRRRVFIVGHSGGIPRPEILAFAEGCSGDTPPRRVQGKEIAGTLGSLSPNGGSRTTDLDGHGAYVVGLDELGGSENYTETPVYNPIGQGSRHLAQLAVAFMENQRAETWEAPIVQAINSGGGKPGQGYPAVRTDTSVRRLTPLECERLQGFPDNWTAGQSDTQRYRQMGNAVAVPVVEWIGRRLVAA